MWFAELLDICTGFIPRPCIIRPDESGFRQIPKFWGGSWITEMLPGNWYFIIPWFSENQVCKTKTQVRDIRAQSCWTSSGENIAVGVSIRYYISDPMKALLQVQDYDQSLSNVVLGGVVEFIQKRTLSELKAQSVQLAEELTKIVRAESKNWGLKIERVAITDIGITQNIRLLLSGLEELKLV